MTRLLPKLLAVLALLWAAPALAQPVDTGAMILRYRPA